MPRPSKSKITVLLLAGLLLLGVLYALWASRASDSQSADSKPSRAERPANVKTVLTQRQNFSVTRDIPATIAPLQQVVVRPQISGQIERLYFEEGQMLNAGQLMATLDSRSLRADLASAEAELAKVHSQLEVAQQEQQRYQSLLSTQAVSQQEVAQLAGQTKQLQAQLRAAQASVQAQQVRLSLTRIIAPIDGRVGLRQVSVGAQIGSNDSNGIATLTQTQPISVQFGLPEQLLGQQTLLGLPVEVRSMGTDQVLAQTTISRQDSQIDRSTGSLSVRAILPNPAEQLRSGQSVRVRIAEQSLPQVVTLPTRAIQQGLNQSFVYVVQDGIAHMTPIIRLAQQGEVSAIDGVEANVAVVIEGQLRLKNGSKVNAVPAMIDQPALLQATPTKATQTGAMPTKATQTGAGT